MSKMTPKQYFQMNNDIIEALVNANEEVEATDLNPPEGYFTQDELVEYCDLCNKEADRLEAERLELISLWEKKNGKIWVDEKEN